MSEDAFGQYLTQWRDANPLHASLWLFLRPEEQQRYGALAALEREWTKALREITEPQVATIKLGWWREEMQRAAAGSASHPLTQALFADARVRSVTPGYWADAVDAAAMAVDAAPAADFAAQRVAALPLARAFARLENAVWFDAERTVARAAEVAMLAWLVADLRALTSEISHGRAPLPMNLLARHGLVLAGLAKDDPARRGALRDYARQLGQALASAATLEGPLTLFRAAQLHADRASLRAAERAADPLQRLLAPQRGLRILLKTWRAARTWRASA